MSKKLAIVLIPGAIAFVTGVLTGIFYKLFEELPLYNKCKKITQLQENSSDSQKKDLVFKSAGIGEKILRTICTVFTAMAASLMFYLWTTIFREVKRVETPLFVTTAGVSILASCIGLKAVTSYSNTPQSPGANGH